MKTTSLDLYRDLARQLRADSIRCSTAAGSGHPTSSLSAADLAAVLLAGHLRYDFADPRAGASDHLIFSKGHASPLVYAMFRAAGAIDDAELLTFRKLGSRLEGHPTPILPWVDVATGSLGQGLAIGVGVALGLRLQKSPAQVWVICGDSETAEGSVWEAFEHAGHERLGNLTAIVDVNRLGQRGPTMLEWDTDTYARRMSAFGWDAIVVDGHDVGAVDEALGRARGAARPTALIARTLKGAGVSFLADQPGWHGKALDAEQAKRACAELGDPVSKTFAVRRPDSWKPSGAAARPPKLPAYSETVATRKAYGETLAAIAAADPSVVALDAEVSNSTYSEDVKKTAPERFLEMYIAEQQMVAAAVGLQVLGFKPFASTFAAFLTRAYDFVRMAPVSRADIRLSGSHAGVSIGEDGPSQMALEDLAMMRAVHGSTVLYPSDPNQTASLVAQMVDRGGVSYVRTTREKTPLLYAAGERFPIGGSRVVRGGAPSDRVTVVAAGITLHEAIKAADALAKDGIAVRVVDAYSVKPIDEETLVRGAVDTERIVVAEDHWPEGGLGSAVLEALARRGHAGVRWRHLAVRVMPGSGKPLELLDAAGISASHITAAVRDLLAR